jgi:hypothetical protein
MWTISYFGKILRFFIPSASKFTAFEPFVLWPAARAAIKEKMQSGSFHFSLSQRR